MSKSTPKEPIAVVSSGCRFAGGITTPSKLWQVLSRPTDLSKTVPRERFTAEAFYHPDGTYHGTTNSIKGYWLDQDHRAFDAGFFHITPKEAEAMDPQQRMVLEVVYEAMASAGYPLHQYAGRDVAVFAGVMTADYDTLSQRDELQTSRYYATGNARSIIANRVSYFFDFRGPSMTIDSACSSSLVAVHQAVQSLRNGESIMACVTGVNLMLTPEQFIVESDLHMLSPTGRCHMWDARADGYARGEGVVALLLKTLSQAVADGDNIHGVIRETGVNSDGRTEGITMPNSAAQARLIQNTYRRAGLDPRKREDRCQYFEAHGTGTVAGDPREAAAINDAFFGGERAEETDEKLLVGSIKTVVGHTEGAAGLAGLLKVLEAMKQGAVPPNLHMQRPSEGVQPFLSHLAVPTQLVAWPQPTQGQPRRASVNSFGFGGTNAHAIVESYEQEDDEEEEGAESLLLLEGEEETKVEREGNKVVGIAAEAAVPLCISAASPRSLPAVARSFRNFLGRHPAASVHQLASCLASSRRDALPYRLAVSVCSRQHALAALDAIAASPAGDELGTRVATMDSPPQLLAIFTGQGAQWPTMARSLLAANPVFRDAIAALDSLLAACDDAPPWSLIDHIQADAAHSRVHEPAIAQPLCTAIQIALVDLLQSLHLSFHTVIGHSSGEIAAAYAAGRLTMRDAILIAYYRGRAVSSFQRHVGQPEGGMLAVGLSEKDALGFCRDPKFAGRLFVAAGNAPAMATISGDIEMVHQAKADLDEMKIMAKILRVDAAYHSPYMAPAAAEYMKALEKCRIAPIAEGNGVVWVSSVYGFTRSSEKDLGAGYWKDNMLYTVQFHDAVEHAFSEYGPYDCAIEIGPHAALKMPVCQTATACGYELPYCGVLDRTKDDSVAVSDFLGFMWSILGPVEVQLSPYVDTLPNKTVVSSYLANLPIYPWDHSQLYYRESRLSRQYQYRDARPHELLGVRCRDDNKYTMRWRNILKQDKIPWLNHHTFQGQSLLPASAYCVMALDAARAFFQGRDPKIIELHDIEIMSGIVIEANPRGTEIAFSMTSYTRTDKTQKSVEASFCLTSCPADGCAEMTLNMTGSVRLLVGDDGSIARRRRPATDSEILPADSHAFYTMMSRIGLDYTGPFRGINSISRRYNHCSAKTPARHQHDTTDLAVSPATLDCCFQTAFLTYAAPGDGSLWGPLLPSRIGRLYFDMGNLCNEKMAPFSRTFHVDACLMQAQRAQRASPATFTADIDIFDDHGIQAIQVEGLVVRSIRGSSTQDSGTLYLHTVLDLDPSHEIIQMQTLAAEPDLYAETRSTVFSSRTYKDTTARTKLRRSSRKSLTPPATEPSHVAHFHRHIGRIVRQIAHRYPRMRCLCLPDEDPNLSARILDQVQECFKSFTIGLTCSDFCHPLKMSQKSRSISTIQLTKDVYEQLVQGPKHELVVLAISLLESMEWPDMLGTIQNLMKPGGFLILVNTNSRHPDSSLHCRDSGILTPPAWPDALAQYGFHAFPKYADQSYPRGQCLYVRQLAFPRLMPTTPLDYKLKIQKVENLVIIGAATDLPHGVLENIQSSLYRSYENIAVRSSFATAETAVLQKCTATIIISDAGTPLDSIMAGHSLERIQSLFRPGMIVLWVIQNSRSGSPGHAAVLGFTRTIAAEVPNLKIQTLDLCAVSCPEKYIIDVFLRLALDTRDIDSEKVLWSQESEVYVDHDRYLIPRVKPLTKMNNRAVAFRCPLTEKLNTANKIIRVLPASHSDGQPGFSAEIVSELSTHRSLSHPMVQVQYSSVQPIRLSSYKSLYLCLGRETPSGHSVIGLAKSNLSKHAPSSMLQSSVLPTMSSRKQQCLLYFASRYLVAKAIVRTTRHRCIVLLNADAGLEDCLTELALDDNYSVQLYTTSPTDTETHRRKLTRKFLHTLSTSREIRQAILPPNQAVNVIDFSVPDNDFSEKIRCSLPATSTCTYVQAWSSFFGEHLEFCDIHCSDFESEFNSIWNDAISKSLSQLSRTAVRRIAVHKHTSILPALLAPRSRPDAFQVLDWAYQEDIDLPVNPFVKQNLLKPTKTYALIGLTRDLGQSLCRLFVEHGARNIVLASRNPGSACPAWANQLGHTHGARILVEKLDVTELDQVAAFKRRLEGELMMPRIAGLINGAMVLEDRIFAHMTPETWTRVMRPKTVGSANLDRVFGSSDDDDDVGGNLDFFIMTSSFAAIGGHPGQSNYAAANMYMNGLAADRRRRGLAGSVLNIGVIYGLGLLHREKGELYAGLEREGYPPISERDVHRMVLEAIVAGRPARPEHGQQHQHQHQQQCLDEDDQDRPYEIIAGLSRFRLGDPNPLHWHLDPRFSHLSIIDGDEDCDGRDPSLPSRGAKGTVTLTSSIPIGEQLSKTTDPRLMTQLILGAFISQLESLLHITTTTSSVATGSDTKQQAAMNICKDSRLSELGVDSLLAVDIRNWAVKKLGVDVAVMKILGSSSIYKLCCEMTEQILAQREKAKMSAATDTNSVRSSNLASKI